MEMRGRWKLAQDQVQSRRLSISSVKQSPSPRSGVSSELHSVHTKMGPGVA